MDEQEPLTAEGRRLKRIRQQMREMDKKKWRHPDADTPQISIVYVWRSEQWIPITWFRGNVTPRRVQRLRTRYRRKRSRATRGRIAGKEIMRIVELRVARSQGGAGKPPIPPVEGKTKAKRGVYPIQGKGRLKSSFAGRRKTTNKTTNLRSRATRVSGTLGRCDYVARGTKCTHRAFWLVGGLDMRKPFGKRRVTRHRCFKHAWDEKFLPPMKQLIRIERKPRKKVAA